jgi:LacI family transcriptional regulator
MKRITIKDIARDLGIHHSTVSRALRASPEINAETIDRVVSYARKNSYQINRNALHLRGTGSNIIGVVVPNIYHNFFSNFVSIVTRLAFASGYIVAVFQSDESVEQEKVIIKSIIQQNIAGVISSLSMETTDVNHFKQLEQYKIPLICFDRIDTSLKKSTVVLDNESALKDVVLNLHNRGYTKIGYLSGTQTIHLFKERQKGYFMGVKEIDSLYKKCVSISDGFTIDRGFEVTKQLFNDADKPDALIFDSHFLAMGALHYLKTFFPDLIDKIGIASFGGYPWLSFSAVNTLIIQQPEEKMAEASFGLLKEAIENPTNYSISALKFQAELI